MDELIQIKCPFDGAILSVKNTPGIEKKNVTCPICKHRYPFTEFRRVSDTQEPVKANDSVNSNWNNVKDSGQDSDVTELPDMNFTLGKIRLRGYNTVYNLHLGANVIGRKGAKSQADFQIDTPDNRAMSREHIVIDVKNVPAKGFVHYLSLYKEKVNNSYIGDDLLMYGDSIILSHGDKIRLPGAELIFELPDEDATEF